MIVINNTFYKRKNNRFTSREIDIIFNNINEKQAFL
jgi:hypothetical protein